MSSRLPESAAKARYVREKFDQIARHYDLFNDLITQGMHRRWKNRLVGRLGLHPEARGLDLCCGTGDIAARSRVLLGGGGGLFLLDFSPNMLRVARRRLGGVRGAGQTAHSRPPDEVLLRGDAMRLPFREGSLDFVTVGYGLRNVTDLKGCLREIQRVLKPGGVLGSLDVGKVGNPLLRPLAEFYFFRIVPLIGRLLQPGQDMFTYLPHSSLEYPDQQAIAGLMKELGFEEVEIIGFVFGASVIHLARKPAGTGR